MAKRQKYKTDFSGVRGIFPSSPHKKRMQEEATDEASTSSTSPMGESLVSSFSSLLRSLYSYR